MHPGNADVPVCSPLLMWDIWDRKHGWMFRRCEACPLITICGLPLAHTLQALSCHTIGLGCRHGRTCCTRRGMNQSNSRRVDLWIGVTSVPSP
jgi:hypothetical protein